MTNGTATPDRSRVVTRVVVPQGTSGAVRVIEQELRVVRRCWMSRVGFGECRHLAFPLLRWLVGTLEPIDPPTYSSSTPFTDYQYTQTPRRPDPTG